MLNLRSVSSAKPAATGPDKRSLAQETQSLVYSSLQCLRGGWIVGGNIGQDFLYISARAPGSDQFKRHSAL